MPRFVVLIHDYPTQHWDLMLEGERGLRTWRLARSPVERVGVDVAAEALATHRAAYLDYEGPVSGGRGSVTRFAAGEYSLLQESPTEVRISLGSEGFPNSCVLRHCEGANWIARFSS